MLRLFFLGHGVSLRFLPLATERHRGHQVPPSVSQGCQVIWKEQKVVPRDLRKNYPAILSLDSATGGWQSVGTEGPQMSSYRKQTNGASLGETNF